MNFFLYEFLNVADRISAVFEVNHIASKKDVGFPFLATSRLFKGG